MLNDDLNMYGQVWKRTSVLSSLIAHQAHHRGQMTVLMRQAGLKVPGVYGPSKEEWAELKCQLKNKPITFPKEGLLTRSKYLILDLHHKMKPRSNLPPLCF